MIYNYYHYSNNNKIYLQDLFTIIIKLESSEIRKIHNVIEVW